MAKTITLDGITKEFGSIVAVDDVSLTIPANEFVTLVVADIVVGPQVLVGLDFPLLGSGAELLDSILPLLFQGVIWDDDQLLTLDTLAGI